MAIRPLLTAFSVVIGQQIREEYRLELYHSPTFSLRVHSACATLEVVE